MRFVAFLRNVNLGQPKSPSREQLEAAFRQAGASSAASFLSNGTLVYSASSRREAHRVARRSGAALKTLCGLREPIFVREYQYLAGLAAADPFAACAEAAIAERAITFFERPAGVVLRAPLESERGDCLVFRIEAGEAFSVTRVVNGKAGYPTPVLEKALGAPVTTRSWTTVLRLLARHG